MNSIQPEVLATSGFFVASRETHNFTPKSLSTMKTQLLPVALIYDFDGTLSPGNMQEFGFIQAIGADIDEFWSRSAQLARDNDASSILTYMYLMVETAKSRGISLTKSDFRRFGSQVELFPGVAQWFMRINEIGKTEGLDVKHYINSSGLREMIEGTPIAPFFENIYACSFLYNADGNAYWPAVAVDYTTKTQFLFKINKGIREISDNSKINSYIPEDQRAMPFERMIYFGDGETDIPCMKMIKLHGGHSIAVCNSTDECKREIARNLIRDDRVNFVCQADYRAGAEIELVVKTILHKIRADYDFKQLLAQHKKV